MFEWKLTIINSDVIDRLVSRKDITCKVEADNEMSARKKAADHFSFSTKLLSKYDDQIISSEVWLSDELSKCEKYHS